MEYDKNVVCCSLRAHRHGTPERFTQREVAKLIGVSGATVFNWENQGSLNVENAWKLANLYHTSIDELVGRGKGNDRC